MTHHRYRHPLPSPPGAVTRPADERAAHPRAVRPRQAGRALGGAVVGALLLASCAAPDDGPDGAAGGEAPRATLTVLGAASLTEVLTEAGEEYEAATDGAADIRFSFAGSQELTAQVQQGIPADVLVTADTDTMDRVAEHTDEPRIVARNSLTIVTAPGNPHGVTELADLADPAVTTVLAAPEVPAGRYAREVLDEAEVAVTPASEEPNVRSVLSRVVLGEADAGIVYATDAVSAGEDVTDVPLPGERNAVAYPAATLRDAPSATEAAAFLDWLAGPEAAELWQDAGFLPP